MTETIFTSASLLATLAWSCLALALTVRAEGLREQLLRFAGRLAPITLCALYVAVLYTNWGTAPNGGFSSLTSVVALFSVPGKMLGGWIHFLAFDLLIGRGVIDHGLAQGYPRAILLLVLPVVFLYGPLGVLAYLLLVILIRKVDPPIEV